MCLKTFEKNKIDSI